MLVRWACSLPVMWWGEEGRKGSQCHRQIASTPTGVKAMVKACASTRQCYSSQQPTYYPGDRGNARTDVLDMAAVQNFYFPVCVSILELSTGHLVRVVVQYHIASHSSDKRMVTFRSSLVSPKRVPLDTVTEAVTLFNTAVVSVTE